MGIFSKLKQTFTNQEEGDRYLSGLKKSKISFGERLRNIALNFRGINENFLEELMITLLEADVGVVTAQKIVDEVENRVLDKKLKEFKSVVECLIEVMHDMYCKCEDRAMQLFEDDVSVLLLVGVNGSGKTTTCAKLAYLYTNQGKKVCVTAADTFRAGAIDQLNTWAKRLKVACIMGKENGDPSATLVDGCRYAKEHQNDIMIGDTAGRLQNKNNLMNELAKMKRVLGREIMNAPHEVLLVLDATTGQNGISQAKVFLETSDVTGIILTKLDGTAKGGIILAIRDQLSLPVRYIGLGEGIDDLRVFDIDAYLYGLCEGMLEDD